MKIVTILPLFLLLIGVVLPASAQNTADLDFRQITSDQDRVIAEIKAKEPYSTVLGAYINGDTGQFVTPPGARFASFVLGSIHVISTLSGSPQSLTTSGNGWPQTLKRGDSPLFAQEAQL